MLITIRQINWSALRLWIIIILLVFALTLDGMNKLIGIGENVHSFARYGYPMWFMYLVGVLEITGAFLLTIARYSFISCLVLGFIMFGAFCTHLLNNEAAMSIPSVVLLILLVEIAHARYAFFGELISKKI